MKNVSIDIAERYGSDLRLWLRSADRLSDCAIARAPAFLKTPDSRSSASLVAITRADQRRVDFGRALRVEAERARLGVRGRFILHLLHRQPSGSRPLRVLYKSDLRGRPCDTAAHAPRRGSGRARRVAGREAAVDAT